MSGNLIISLDCEGKWGLFNKLSSTKKFTNKELLNTYSKIQNLLNVYDFSATYAFVSAFLLKENEKKNFSCFFEKNEAYSKSLKVYNSLGQNEKAEGWFLPEVLDIVNKSTNEIACHSFSHLAFDEKIEKKLIINELENCHKVAKIKKLEFKTFIFPYNIIGHQELLKNYSFLGYRYHKKNIKNFYFKILNFLQEFNIYQSIKKYAKFEEGQLIKIPGDFFFNWRHKMRKALVPQSITILRWKNLLKKAVDEKLTLNLWFHPHNLISGPETYKVLEEVLGKAAILRDQGKLNIITQLDYVKIINQNNDKKIN